MIARAAAAVAVALCVGAPIAAAADPILPVEQVTPGMVGEARTVLKGTEITSLPVEVIDVQRSAPGPGGTVILFRATGPLWDATGGIAQGMSGSPVYVTGADGVPRVIGALAFGTGDEAGRVGGITPIEQMLNARALIEEPPQSFVARPLIEARTRSRAVRIERARPSVRATYPLATLVVSGLSPAVAKASRVELSRLAGVDAVRSAAQRLIPPQPFVPGSTLSYFLAGGDISAGGIGTTTYVDGDLVYGFGHPIFGGLGPTRLLLGDGYVYGVVAAPITSFGYKLADLGSVRGELLVDSADGVVGRVGPAAGIALSAHAFDRASGRESRHEVLLAPDERLAPFLTDVIQRQSVLEARQGQGPGTVGIRVRIEGPDLATPIRFKNRYATAGNAVFDPSPVAARHVLILLQNAVESVDISRISIDQTIDREVRAARILGARITPRRARPGARVTLALVVQPYREARRVIEVPMRVPAGLAPGLRQLRILPNDSTDGYNPQPSDPLEVGGGFSAASPPTRRLVARVDALARSGRASRVLRVRRALTRVLPRRHDAVRVYRPGEIADDSPDAGAGNAVIVPYVIYGGAASVPVQVLPAAPR